MPNKGRPSKLTAELQSRICDAIRAGNYIETASAYAGISKDTLYNWMKKGAREKERVAGTSRSIRKKEQIYVDFSDAVEKALAEAEVRDLIIISNAAKNDWKAAAWKLERKFPKKWGRKEQVSADIKTEHSGEVVERNEHDISITHKIEEYADVYEKLAQRGPVESTNESDNT